MKVISSNKRKIAWVMLLISCVNILRPTASFALTSGPTQPETEGFKAVGVSDMVDLQTGDFKYNIPLFDIDGYPVNLSYQSGAGIDDEASWVGLGWSLNTGSINRQVRGIADDMEGDAVTVDHMTKPNVTIGGRITGKVETLGAGKKIGGSGSLSTGIFVNNYTGIGAEQSVNAGISLSLANKGTLTAGLGGGISSNTQRGVDASPYMSLSLYDKSQDKSQVSAGLSASLGYNSRSGMKNFGLGASFSAEQYQSKTVVTKDAGGNDVSKTESTANLLGAGAGLYSISYNTEPINPRIQVPYSISSWSYSIDGGYSFPAVFWGGGLTGYKTVTQVLTPKIVKPAYGFLYAEKGKNNPDAAMDFIRENDNPVIPELPNLAVPVQTPDMYSFTSQEGSGQFRLYRGGTGAFFDSQAQDQSDNTSFGLDAGFGAATAHFGVTLFKQSVHTTTRKWAKDNNYLKVGDFQDQSLTVPAQEHVYFKVAGEKTIQDNALTQKMRGLQPLKVSLNGKQALAGFDGYADAQAAITNLNRQPKTTMISYLTADEAKLTGFDRSINDYLPVDAAGIPAVLNDKPQVKQSYPRVDPFDQTSKSGNTYNVQQQMQVDNQEEPDEYPVHKGHHVSEFTVTDPGGKRMIYGLPVYNVKEDEYTFAIGNSYTATNNIVQLTNSGTADNPVVNVKNKGIDEYSHKESKPPYATSYMLTEILSPDYVDKSGNGISDDDQGTAIKFNYSRLPYLYNWRAPYQGATLNKGLLADPDDDKASIIYGKKEIWYVSSIESKTKVAYFITKDRNDAIGASDDWSQGGQNRNLKQKCLTEIRLYAKSDMTKPIKVVKFQYDYTLCPFVPNYYDPANPTATGGKLTLKKVWFEYQNIDRGKYNPYVFTYNQPTVTAINQPGAYGYLSTDRWGVYKSPGENPDPSLTNEEFPYTNQQKSVVDQNVALWQLKKIGLPTGGNINVSYESDDYAYVQNRHAMSMYTITGLTDGANGADIDWAAPDAVNKMHGIKMLLPNNMEPPTNLTGAPLLAWFKKNYLDGSDYMYTKMSVWMSTDNNPLNGNTNGNYWDFIPSYNFVSGVSYDTNTNIMKIVFQDVKAGSLSRSPVTVSAWQRMKIDYPRYAYNGFYNRPG
ncbi:MAG: hypothetical protein JWQ57_566, partial [Mucilaginibacter sp.]|nr:hypothetical protein [Mucilaginibacter sp.]